MSLNSHDRKKRKSGECNQPFGSVDCRREYRYPNSPATQCQFGIAPIPASQKGLHAPVKRFTGRIGLGQQPATSLIFFVARTLQPAAPPDLESPPTLSKIVCFENSKPRLVLRVGVWRFGRWILGLCRGKMATSEKVLWQVGDSLLVRLNVCRYKLLTFNYLQLFGGFRPPKQKYNKITNVQLIPSAPTCHNTMLAEVYFCPLSFFSRAGSTFLYRFASQVISHPLT